MSTKPYTIAMEYHPYLSSGNTPYAAAPASAAVTAHYDEQHPDDPIRTFLFRDGTGRLLQTKRDAEVDGVPQLVASGPPVVSSMQFSTCSRSRIP